MVERTSIDDVRMRRAKPPTELIGQNSFIFIKNHHISFFYNSPDISKIIITFAVLTATTHVHTIYIDIQPA